MNDFVWNILQN